MPTLFRGIWRFIFWHSQPFETPNTFFPCLSPSAATGGPTGIIYFQKKKEKKNNNNTPFRHQKINSVSREAPLSRGIYSNATTRARQKARGWRTSCGTQIKEPLAFCVCATCHLVSSIFFFLNDRGIIIDCLNVASFWHNETLFD